jgi:hypothetical protein
VSSSITPVLEQFIVEHLRSLEHMEALLLLERDARQWWTADALAGFLGISPGMAEQILDELCSANLLNVRVASAVSYQFSPGSPEMSRLVLDLVEALRYARPRIYALITSRSSRALWEFADAFRWRRRRDDG